MALKRATYTQPRKTIKDVFLSRRAWGFVKKVLSVRTTGTDPSADLGGSSKYSNENFED
jgi:hypothetical protein